MANQQEFIRLFIASEMDIYRYVGSMVPNSADTQDIVQQTAVLLWEKFDDYDSERPFSPWACRFARNVARQWMDRQKHWKTFLDQEVLDIIVSEREEMKPEIDERLGHLRQCVQKLPQDQKIILNNYYAHQMNIDTVAERADKSVDATYKSLQRIRKRLRTCIELKFEDQGVMS